MTSLGLAVVAALEWRAARPEALPVRAIPADMVGTASESSNVALGEDVMRVVARDLFRLARRPAVVPFGAAALPVTAPPPRSPVPSLRLTGILGPPWRAVVEGAPGVDEGTLVSAGDTLAGARVHAISSETVTFRTSDTTWTLTLRRPE